MRLTWIDWGVVLVFIAYSLWIGLRYTRKASQSVEQYFLSGRTIGWWLAGTSMVAAPDLVLDLPGGSTCLGEDEEIRFLPQGPAGRVC